MRLQLETCLNHMILWSTTPLVSRMCTMSTREQSSRKSSESSLPSTLFVQKFDTMRICMVSRGCGQSQHMLGVHFSAPSSVYHRPLRRASSDLGFVAFGVLAAVALCVYVCAAFSRQPYPVCVCHIWCCVVLCGPVEELVGCLGHC